MGPRRIRLGSQESVKALAAWENDRLDPPDDEGADVERDDDVYLDCEPDDMREGGW